MAIASSAGVLMAQVAANPSTVPGPGVAPSTTEPQAATITRVPSSISTMGRSDVPGAGAMSEVAPGDSGVLPATRATVGGSRDERPFSAYMSYRLTKAEGLPNGPGERYESTVHEFTPGISWQIGDHWHVAYSPTWTWYTNDGLEDTVDHTASVGWRTQFEGWRLTADHRTAITNSVTIETGEQTERNQHQTSIGSSKSLNSQLSWDQRLRHNLRRSDRFADFREYSLEEGISQRFGERLNASLSALYGYVQMSEGANHQHISPRLNAQWDVGEKTSLAGWVGVEHRWFTEQLGSTTNPVVDLSLNYRPAESNSLSVGYNRAVSPSFFSNTVTRRDVIDASFTQRFLARYYLTISASRRTASYTSIAGGTVDGRRDRNVRYGAQLSTHLGMNGSLSLFYNPEADNESNRPNYTYSVRSYGAEINYRF